MKTIKIYCRACNLALTEPLTEVQEITLRMEDATDVLQAGQFSILNYSDQNHLIISLDEGDLKDHTDKVRFQGCCGSGGLDGLNKLCKNGHEVATEFSDCYMPHFIDFDLEKVIIKQKISDYDYIKIMI